MTYTGRTEVGGQPQIRDLGTLRLTKLAVGPLDNNVYLLEGNQGSRVLVDAAADPDAIMALIPDGKLDRIVTTHRHGDHWAALADIASRTGATTYAGRDDAEGIGTPTAVALDHDDTIELDDAVLHVITLRGHTPGGIALAFTDGNGSWHVITGDSLFPGGVGRTTPDTFPTLLDDVTSRLFDRFDDATWIYPGHGYDTTLGAERPELDNWRERGW